MQTARSALTFEKGRFHGTSLELAAEALFFFLVRIPTQHAPVVSILFPRFVPELASPLITLHVSPSLLALR